MSARGSQPPSICFVGINNLPALAPEFRHLGMGGAELQQTLLARALARRGFAVSMVVADLGQPDGAEWSGVKTFAAYRPDSGVPGLRFLHPRWSGVWGALRRANARLHYSSCADWVPGGLALYAQRHGTRFAFRIAHDSDCQPDKLLIPNWHGKALYRYGLRHVDLILAQSATQQAQMQQNFQRASVVLPSLVDVAAGEHQARTRDIDLLWVSNIRSFKRPDLALALAQRLPDLSLHMIGGTQPGSEAYFEEIRSRAACTPNVTFHGGLPYDSVNAHMSRARLFINTSDSEGFPNTYMQAWARGTPVVATFDPDGVIQRAALGVAVRNLDEMQVAIRGLLGDAAAWTAASDRCRSYVRARHGDGAADRYAEALLPLAAAAAA
jgi:glycosyltransferase involved in cell wall biosynthesis